jgi:hypothetical protein
VLINSEGDLMNGNEIRIPTVTMDVDISQFVLTNFVRTCVCVCVHVHARVRGWVGGCMCMSKDKGRIKFWRVMSVHTVHA